MQGLKFTHVSKGTRDQYSIVSVSVVDAAAGGSDDWAKGVAGIPYAYTLELQDNGYYGFVLPPSYIEPQGREIWAALRVMSREIYKKRNDFRWWKWWK